MKNIFFLGCHDGGLLQYSLATDSIVKDHGCIIERGIHSQAVTPDSKTLFVADFIGNLKKWSIDGQYVVKNYGNVHQSQIKSMQITADGTFLFTGSVDKTVKQFSVRDQVMVRDFGIIHDTGFSYNWVFDKKPIFELFQHLTPYLSII